MTEETDRLNAKKPPQRLYATLQNPNVYAAVKSLYSFDNEKQATSKLRQLKKSFVTSKQGDQAEHPVIIWIRGYEINEGELAMGYKGNFASLSVAKCKDDRFTINAVKIEADISYHPERRRIKQRHPDWGQPILRDIKKKLEHNTIEKASNELRRLHKEYPEISIPFDNGLYIMVYEKIEGINSPVQKYKMWVKPLPNGMYLIEYKRQKPKNIFSQKPKESKGYFSQKEKLRRTMKKQQGVMLPATGGAENSEVSH